MQDQAGGGGAPDADEDTGAAGETDDVPDDEEVVGKPGLANDLELVLKAGAVFVVVGKVLGLEPLPAESFEVLVGAHAVRRRKGGQALVLKLEVKVAGLSDFGGDADGLGQVVKKGGHLGRGFQVVGIVGELIRVLSARVLLICTARNRSWASWSPWLV